MIAGARRRPARPAPEHGPPQTPRPPTVLVACGALVGFLLALAVVSGTSGREERNERRQQLVELVRDRRDEATDLDRHVAALRAEVAAASDVPAGSAAGELAAQAGTTALEGSGIVVRLADATEIPDDAQVTGAYRIQDRDLQLVVNALFAAGADAVAINDSRVVVTTPVRNAGGVIVVNFRPQSPPFEVAAIGADREAFDASDIAVRFRRWRDLFGLGFSVSQPDRVEVPAFSGRVGITHAIPEPVEEPGPEEGDS